MEQDQLLRAVRVVLICAWTVLALGMCIVLLATNPSFLSGESSSEKKPSPKKLANEKLFWSPPDSTSIPQTEEGRLILYGRELISHTAVYLGPKGKVKAISNGMNCQNCHLKAGTVIYGNNYSAVASTYPKFRDRSGIVESIEKRVNDCMERSLNGKKLNNESKEMRAIVSYIKWVGKDVPKKKSPEGVGLWSVPYLERAADPSKGKIAYQKNCMRCHGPEGTGMMKEDGMEWRYPPLCGDNSFNIGAGLFRLSRFAGYVKANMPSDLATFEKPVLSDEESWDVAAYVLSMPHPSKDISKDWPDISKKPVDYPFGPYTDGHSEEQHKFGPFASILAAKKNSAR